MKVRVSTLESAHCALAFERAARLLPRAIKKNQTNSAQRPTIVRMGEATPPPICFIETYFG